MPDLSLLTQLAKKLEISVYELLTGEENKSNIINKENIETEVRYYSLLEEEKLITY